MKDKNLKYIAHAIIVVAYMGLIAFVIYFTGKTAFLWLLLFVFLYQPWENPKTNVSENDEE